MRHGVIPADEKTPRAFIYMPSLVSCIATYRLPCGPVGSHTPGGVQPTPLLPLALNQILKLPVLINNM